MENPKLKFLDIVAEELNKALGGEPLKPGEETFVVLNDAVIQAVNEEGDLKFYVSLGEPLVLDMSTGLNQLNEMQV
ncbi:hypothetical protein [Bacillus sp. FSL M8-0168]|uniref:hypothetical protein n=1 Tax=Bacillus sp. FSL M8-0168 TaxID=2921614 RepID=UPI0030FDAAC3